MLNEMDKLEKCLDALGFNFKRNDINQFCPSVPYDQIIVYNENNERIWDAVCFNGSYGGEFGLLEVMGTIVPEDNEDGVIGFLTALEVLHLLEP